MVPPPAPRSAPPLTRSSTLPAVPSKNPPHHDRSHLAPEDAIFQASPPRRSTAVNTLRAANGGDSSRVNRRDRHNDRTKSSSRRRKATWKKLLWVKQSYPDNYTDQETFLEHLQRNPRLQLYDFWPLVADSTVIVQHVCSVIIFVVCFVGIRQEKLSPVSVAGWGSIATFLGWLLWDLWVGQEESTRMALPQPRPFMHDISTTSSTPNLPTSPANGLRNAHSISTSSLHSSASAPPPRISSTTSFQSSSSAQPPSRLNSTTSLLSASSTQRQPPPPAISTTSLISTSSPQPQTPTPRPPLTFTPHHSPFSHRTSLRLSTAKSALLIYFTLLGLSPILKSLTRSTSSDSIWAMSFLLFTINIFFFDYAAPSSPSSTHTTTIVPSSTTTSTSTSAGNKNIPASLSTNAALMASTVLASRLPSTGQVFSLTLFSIEVFGLFPVFRRYTRIHSFRGHLLLTLLLVLGAGGGMGLVLPGEGREAWGWKSGVLGMVGGFFITGLAMGGCSWWLIGLQKYKNEIHGPWDPARPVIRGGWGEGF
ncbi:phosphatidylinositol N-acetylglucosaminyltransferase protein [Rutstroemia sp. NJR-2017a WRK4]|nr:phosphatidylinositol N-acetylglucosaminyltransferase protein [Rutstroemia sp. NJR-2017a WRK4]